MILSFKPVQQMHIYEFNFFRVTIFLKEEGDVIGRHQEQTNIPLEATLTDVFR